MGKHIRMRMTVFKFSFREVYCRVMITNPIYYSSGYPAWSESLLDPSVISMVLSRIGSKKSFRFFTIHLPAAMSTSIFSINLSIINTSGFSQSSWPNITSSLPFNTIRPHSDSVQCADDSLISFKSSIVSLCLTFTLSCSLSLEWGWLYSKFSFRMIYCSFMIPNTNPAWPQVYKTCFHARLNWAWNFNCL